jgi:hypothetical protein
MPKRRRRPPSPLLCDLSFVLCSSNLPDVLFTEPSNVPLQTTHTPAQRFLSSAQQKPGAPAPPASFAFVFEFEFEFAAALAAACSRPQPRQLRDAVHGPPRPLRQHLATPRLSDSIARPHVADVPRSHRHHHHCLAPLAHAAALQPPQSRLRRVWRAVFVLIVGACVNRLHQRRQTGTATTQSSFF